MAGLTGLQLKNTYGDLLAFSNSNAGVTATLQNVIDGLGATTGLWVSTTQIGVGSTGDQGFKRVAAGVIAMTDGGAGVGWLQQSAGRARVTADVTNTSATFANLTDLTITVKAGRKYFGRLVIKCVNDQATEGAKFDFGGGTATATSFWAATGVLVSGTPTAGTVIATALDGAMNYTGLVGETVFVCEFSLVVNAGGTLIPRQAKDATGLGGTLTTRLGSYLTLDDSPN